jgi:hypothetical protein
MLCREPFVGHPMIAPAITHEAGAFDFERGSVPGKALDDRAFTASPMAQGIAKCAAILVSLADEIDEFADACSIS